MNKTAQELVEKIHWGANPYEGHDRAMWPVSQFFEWDSKHPWLSQLVASFKPKLIIEVGSFLGGSAITMGDALAANGLADSAVLCVDSWLAEEILWSMPEHRPKLNFRCGSPCFYQTFLSNILECGLENSVIPLRMPSFPASRYIVGRGVPKAQLIYIDGSHIEGEVLRDLELYWPLLESKGCMVMDDYNPPEPMFKGLVRDVDRFCQSHGLKLEINGTKARVFKP